MIQSVLWKIGLMHSRSRSQQRFKMLVNVCSDDISWTAEYFAMVMLQQQPECNAEEKNCCYLQGQGHSSGSCDQNMTLSAISFELLIPWQLNLVWFAIISQRVLWKKLDDCIQGQGHSEVSKCQCLSRYLLNRLTFTTKLGIVKHHHELECMQEDWFAIFKVKVIARAYMIKIWQFVLCLLNCWSFCYQTWFDVWLL